MLKVIAVGNKVTREIDGAVLLCVPFSVFVVMRIEPRSMSLLSKCSAMEPHTHQVTGQSQSKPLPEPRTQIRFSLSSMW